MTVREPINDYVEHEHKKNLYRVVVGARGVQLAWNVEDLDGKIRAANTDINTKKRDASSGLPEETALETYLSRQPIEDIETKIRQKSSEVTKLLNGWQSASPGVRHDRKQ